jgi:23S rRNA (uracil1939-C5)-methyltransferase
LGWKRDVVRNALQRIGGFADVEVRETVGMVAPRNYRNKMSLVIDHRSALPSLGFYKQRSHDVVPIDACPIVMPQLSDYVARLNAGRLDDEIAGVLEPARHVVARTARATGQAVFTVTTEHASSAVERGAASLQARLPGVVGVTNSFDLNSENAILGRRQQVVAGTPEIEETIHGIRYRVSAASFFQVNVEIVGRIFEFMKRGLTVPRRIVDLYCGAGTFALYFAKHGCDVFGVEENSSAVAEADANAELNGLQERVRVRSGRVEDVLCSAEGRDELRHAQIVFLDPPRKGSDEATLGAVASAGVTNIWYLSCDPATLARDLKFLTAKGFRFGVVQPFDMFPQTGHVETLVTLYNEAGAARITVEDAFEGAPPPAAWPADDRFAHDRPEYPDFVIRKD